MWCLWSHASFIVSTMVGSLSNSWLKRWAWWDLFQNHMVSIHLVTSLKLLKYLWHAKLWWDLLNIIFVLSQVWFDTLILWCSLADTSVLLMHIPILCPFFRRHSAFLYVIFLSSVAYTTNHFCKIISQDSRMCRNCLSTNKMMGQERPSCAWSLSIDSFS
jgi:hypothetical protein